jgi:hypothetical protein
MKFIPFIFGYFGRKNIGSMISGSLSPRHGASSGCGWRNGFYIWRVAANILIKQPTRGGPPAWRLGEVLTTPHLQKSPCYETYHKASDLD